MDMGDGMMSDGDMAVLESAEGADAARLFLEQMITHHEGAIEMALAEPSIDATVGVFVQNPVGQILGSIPVLSNLVSNRGLVGGYFEVKGLLEDPAVKSLPAASITEALPQILQWPLRAIGALPAPNAPGNATDPPDEDASALEPLRASPRNRRPGAAGN